MCFKGKKSSHKCHRLYSCHPVPQSLRDLRARSLSSSPSQRRPTALPLWGSPGTTSVLSLDCKQLESKQAPLCLTSASSHRPVQCLARCSVVILLLLQVLNKSSVMEPRAKHIYPCHLSNSGRLGWSPRRGRRNKSALWAPPVSPPSRCGRREPRLEWWTEALWVGSPREGLASSTNSPPRRCESWLLAVISPERRNEALTRCKGSR